MKYFYIAIAILGFGGWPLINQRYGMGGIDIVFMSLFSVIVVALIYTPQYRHWSIIVSAICVILLVIYSKDNVAEYTNQAIVMNCIGGLMNGIGMWGYGQALADNPKDATIVIIITIGITLFVAILNALINGVMSLRQVAGVLLAIAAIYLLKPK